MTGLPLATAVTGCREAPLVAGLESVAGVRVVRRCADLTDLLAVAAAGLVQGAVVSADLPGLDGEALSRLRAGAVAVVVLSDPGDRARSQRLRLLGLTPLALDSPPAEVAETVLGAVAGLPGNSAGSSDRVQPPGPDQWQVRLPCPGQGIGPVPAAGSTPLPARPWGRGNVLAVWGPTGAPGRTTVALGVASELALAGWPTVIADADTYGPSVAQSLALLDESAGLAAAVRAANQGCLDVERLARLAPVVQPGLRVLTGIPRPSRWPELRSSGLHTVWQVVRELAAWTVVDCGFGLESDEEVSFDIAVPRRNAATLCTLAEADVVLAVGSADPVGLHRLVRGLQDLREVLHPGRSRRVVVSRVRESSVGPFPQRRITDALARYAGVTHPVLLPDDRDACDAAMLAGRSLAHVAAQSPLRRALARLAGELVGVSAAAASGPAPDPRAARGRGARRGRARPVGGAVAPDRLS